MNVHGELFSKDKKKEQVENLLKITEIVRPLIYKTVGKIVQTYKMELLSQPTDYIVLAIWGGKKGGELDRTQKKIRGQLIPVMENLLDELQLRGLSVSQKFGIEFLIRELFISKIAYMVDGIRNMAILKICQQEQDPYILNHMEVMGSA